MRDRLACLRRGLGFGSQVLSRVWVSICGIAPPGSARVAAVALDARMMNPTLANWTSEGSQSVTNCHRLEFARKSYLQRPPKRAAVAVTAAVSVRHRCAGMYGFGLTLMCGMKVV